MDPRLPPLSGSSNGVRQGSQPSQSVFSFQVQNQVVGGPRFELVFPDLALTGGPRFENSISDHNFRDFHHHHHLPPNDPTLGNSVPSSSTSAEEEFHEDCDFSDDVLRYINQMLMEEDMEDKTCMLQESLDFQAKEKSFYDVIGSKYPPSPEYNSTFIDQSSSSRSPDDYFSENIYSWPITCSNGSNYLMDPSLINYLPSCHNHSIQSRIFPAISSYSLFDSSNSLINSVDGFLDSPVSPLQLCDLYNEIQSVSHFKKGVEEARKLLPSGNRLLIDLDANGLLPPDLKVETVKAEVRDEKNEEAEKNNSSTGLRGRKNFQREDADLGEERCSKLAAVYPESIVRSEEFDIVLLCSMGKALATYRETLHKGSSKTWQQNEQSRRSGGVKGGRGKRQNGKKEVVDLRTLLIHCAQAVAADDRRSANELLKQIRLHSSPFGDGNQRLAHCLADGLEARLAGSGSQIHKALISKRTSAADYLKAYRLYLAICPFRKISNFVSSKTIIVKAKSATRVHVIDFGILYGFQWPTFIQKIAERPNGPPKLRITGIEFPQPGFRPAERINETGRRLADYAQTFDVPFEYHAIAKKWETIKVEDLKLDKDEFLVVNCLYRSQNLFDETVVVDSSRNVVLNLIKKINPDIFIHGIVNGAYSAPFFVTRFREALFHFSALFDMLENNVPREHSERMLIEREMIGREALNVTACEGWERVERPETYKQWQVRHLRAGFMQLPFEREIMRRATDKVRSIYHKDFVIDEDSQWLLQGWKGRIIFALSCWKPLLGT